MKVFICFLISSFVLSAGAADAAEYDCEGCGALSSAASKLAKTPAKDDAARYDAVVKVVSAIKALRRKMDGTWTDSQVSEVIKTLRAEKDMQMRQFIMAGNPVYLEDNRAALAKQLDKIGGAEAKRILFEIDAVIRESKDGNGSGDPELEKRQQELNDEDDGDDEPVKPKAEASKPKVEAPKATPKKK